MPGRHSIAQSHSASHKRSASANQHATHRNSTAVPDWRARVGTQAGVMLRPERVGTVARDSEHAIRGMQAMRSAYRAHSTLDSTPASTGRQIEERVNRLRASTTSSAPLGAPPLATLMLLLSQVRLPAPHAAIGERSNARNEDAPMQRIRRGIGAGRSLIYSPPIDLTATATTPTATAAALRTPSVYCASVRPSSPTFEAFGRLLVVRGATPGVDGGRVPLLSIRRVAALVALGSRENAQCWMPAVLEGVRLGQEGGASGEALSATEERRLLAEVIEIVAFGETGSPSWRFAEGVLRDAAQRGLSLAETKRSIEERIAERVKGSNELNRDAASLLIEQNAPLLLRNDIDASVRFGSPEWVDLQTGFDLCIADGLDPATLTAFDLVRVARAADAATRLAQASMSEESQWSSDMTLAEREVVRDSIEGVAFATSSVAVLHALYRQNPVVMKAVEAASDTDLSDAAFDAAARAVSQTLDGLWSAQIGAIPWVVDAVQQSIQLLESQPTSRRELAREIVQEKMTLRGAALTDTQLESLANDYMTEPSGQWRAFALPNLDARYAEQWTAHRWKLLEALSGVIQTRLASLYGVDWLASMGGLSMDQVEIIAPIVKHMAWERPDGVFAPAQWRAHVHHASFGQVIIGVKRPPGWRYGLLDLDAVLRDVLSLGHLPANVTFNDTDVLALVGRNHEGLFDRRRLNDRTPPV